MPLDAIVLLGWMEREFAVKYLLNDCVFDPPLTEAGALTLWERYRERVEALPDRAVHSPERLQLGPDEQRAAEEFLRFHQQFGPQGSVRDVIKIDPSALVTYQFYIALDRVARYADHANARSWCARQCLVTVRTPQPIQIQHRINEANIGVPHGEFAFIYDQRDKKFEVLEQARHVSVTEYSGRMILWAGYHRSYARMASANPEGMERSLLVALTTDADFFVSEESPNQGLRAMVCGPRPSLLEDFFDDRFFIRLRLRRKRYELQVRAQVVPINDE